MSDDRISERAADLLPEERAAGSDDPRAQAAAILADSDDREFDPEPLEERGSAETAATGDATR
jgi:transglutaminase-like putative cysteine protease